MKSNKKNCNCTKTDNNAPIDLASLSRFQLASLVCNLRRAAQREVLLELAKLEHIDIDGKEAKTQ